MTLKHPPLRRSLFFLITSSITVFSSQSFAQYQASAYAGSEYPFASTTTPGDVSYTYDGTGRTGTSASTTVSFTASPVASVSAETTASNPFGQSIIGGGGIMTYNFEVAAQPFTSVPIDFSGLYSSYAYSPYGGNNPSTSTRFLIQPTSGIPYAQFTSYFFGNCGNPGCLQYTNTTFDNTTYTSTRSDPYHVAGSFQGTLDMLTAADGKAKGFVQLYASAGVNVNGFAASASAFIDPHLEIDPAYLAAHPDATLTLTSGVGNQITATVAAVPEPGTCVLMLAGLSIVGIASRRRARRRR